MFHACTHAWVDDDSALRGELDVFFFKQKTAYVVLRGLVGSEMCIGDRRKGSVARDSGFLARCLISKPATTQGKRFINGAVIPGGSLTAFHERLMELARGSIEKSSEDERYCLHFSPEAQKIFIEHYNVLEQDLSPSGPLSPFRGHVSKKKENIGRIAALIQ